MMMDSGFPYGDIIVIGAIAAFILLRYRAMLGEPRGRDENSIRQASTKPAPGDRVLQLPIGKVMVVPEAKDDFSGKYGTLAETFVAMRAIDREFTPDEFLTGARAAYEMVITAFSKGDRDTLKMLLSPDIYKSFDLSLTEAANAKRFNDTTLVAVSKADITAAKLSGSTATLTVDFSSEQIHLIRDEAGTILEGNPSQNDIIEDQWVFTRDLKSNNFNWMIVET
jgi:predicted lipid-binding transport protein (Tim44 family)